MFTKYLIKLNGTEITTIKQLREARGETFDIELIDIYKKDKWKLNGTITEITTKTRFGYTAWVMDIHATENRPAGKGELFENGVVVEKYHEMKIDDVWRIGFAIKY